MPDLAALDAARDATNAQAVAEPAAQRNGFALSTPDNTVAAANTFTAGAGRGIGRAGERQLTARPHLRLRHPHGAGPGGGGVRDSKQAGFALESSLAGSDTTKAPLLRPWSAR